MRDAEALKRSLSATSNSRVTLNEQGIRNERTSSASRFARPAAACEGAACAPASLGSSSHRRDRAQGEVALSLPSSSRIWAGISRPGTASARHPAGSRLSGARAPLGVSPSGIRVQGLDYSEPHRLRRRSWRHLSDHPSPDTAAVRGRDRADGSLRCRSLACR
jgi:hypothetical protein